MAEEPVTLSPVIGWRGGSVATSWHTCISVRSLAVRGLTSLCLMAGIGEAAFMAGEDMLHGERGAAGASSRGRSEVASRTSGRWRS